MEFQLRYSGEDDKAFGLAGMAISLASLDALDRIEEIFLDSEGPMVRFSHLYFHTLSPSLSPKAVWNNMVRNLHLTASLVVSNVMARTMVRLGEMANREVFNELRELVREEGRDACELDIEEADAMFDRVVRQSHQLFHNPRLHPAVKELAGVISRKRRLTMMELADELEMLRL